MSRLQPADDDLDGVALLLNAAADIVIRSPSPLQSHLLAIWGRHFSRMLLDGGAREDVAAAFGTRCEQAIRSLVEERASLDKLQSSESP